MTIYELTFDLWETIRSAKITDDDNLDHRLLANWVHNQRALWIKRKYDKIKDYDDNLCQTINVPLNIIDPASLYAYNFGIGINQISTTYESISRILRSTIEIPPTIELNYGNTIASINTVDFSQYNGIVNLVNPNHFKVVGNGKFNKNLVFGSIINGRLCIKYSTKKYSI